MSYYCNGCNYTTRQKSHFQKHEKTQKHLDNCKYICIGCNKKYSTQHTLTQHMLSVCKQAIDDQTNDNININKDVKIAQLVATIKLMEVQVENKTLAAENKYLKCNLDDKKKLIEDKDKQLEDKERLNHKLTNIANKSMNALTYVMTYYPNAPPLQKIQDSSILCLGNENYTVPEVVLHYYKKNMLSQHIADKILSKYKKDNPKEQSVWNSDVARHTYVMKQEDKINKKTKGWTRDKKGVSVSSYIIEPLLSKTKIELLDHIKELNEELDNAKDKTTKRCQTIIKNVPMFHDIIKMIDNESLSNEIIKHISPKLQLTMIDKDIGIDINIDELSDDDNNKNTKKPSNNKKKVKTNKKVNNKSDAKKNEDSNTIDLTKNATIDDYTDTDVDTDVDIDTTDTESSDDIYVKHN